MVFYVLGEEPKNFRKISDSHFNILLARKVTCSKFQIEFPKYYDSTKCSRQGDRATGICAHIFCEFYVFVNFILQDLVSLFSEIFII